MMTASGRKERVMIACVTFETVKITEPVFFYQSTRVHLIHYVKNDDERSKVYRSFYDRVCEIIGESPMNIEIVEHNKNVSNFDKMLAEVLSIIQSEKKKDKNCDIMVNISAGSSEYAAASAIASMMSPGVVPFSVNASEYTIKEVEDIKAAYFRDDKPVGLAAKVYEPRVLPYYTIEKPKEHLVMALRILDQRTDSKQPTSSSAMGPYLREKNVWFREENKKKDKVRQSDAVNYHRDFVTKWLELGWVEKHEFQNRYVLTEKGRNIIKTFYIENDKSGTEEVK